MYKHKKILALITARGGSKGIPRKNIKLLGGKPLICWTIETALKSPFVDKLILSSEDAEIIDIVKTAGCDVPFIRPQHLAQDETGSMDVIMHALSEVKEDYDYLLLLQPTSPFRSTEDINKIIQSGIDRDASVMVSVNKCKKHPYFIYESQDGYLKPLLGYKQQIRRQDLPPVYEHNGALYLAKVDFLKQVKSYNAPEAMLFEMEGSANLDIDDADDWSYAEYLVAQGRV
jgi:CMP-N,N'-diacetyllegionaminic acid synthase